MATGTEYALSGRFVFTLPMLIRVEFCTKPARTPKFGATSRSRYTELSRTWVFFRFGSSCVDAVPPATETSCPCSPGSKMPLRFGSVQRYVSDHVVEFGFGARFGPGYWSNCP